MRLAYSLKKTFVFMLCGILSLTLVGCRDHKANEPISLGEYIHEIIQRAGIESDATNVPYYLNIQKENPYFEDVQKAVQWGVLDQITPLDTNELLTLLVTI